MEEEDLNWQAPDGAARRREEEDMKLRGAEKEAAGAKAREEKEEELKVWTAEKEGTHLSAMA